MHHPKKEKGVEKEKVKEEKRRGVKARFYECVQNSKKSKNSEGEGV
jgi:hypothetical protein